MAITSRSSKPSEWAAKINHTHLINDPFIKSFIDNCHLPKDCADVDIADISEINTLPQNINNPINYILTVDGGYTIVEPKKTFPSSQIAFFQFGAILLKTKDLNDLSEKPFIFPEDMQKLHNLERLKLAIPIKGITRRKENSLNNSIRKTLHEFFLQDRGDGTSLMESLKWLLFREYKNTPTEKYTLGSDPNKNIEDCKIDIIRSQIKSDFTFESSSGLIYLTDVFRLHEIVDEEHGASGLLGYLTRAVEQLIIVYYIHYLYKKQSSLIKEFLFVSDGPLSFAGQTARLHQPLRELCNFLREKNNLFLVGVEKSGAFTEHAQQICSTKDSILKHGQYILLNNQYIYKYIIPGEADKTTYGSTSYYSGKVIFHSNDKQILTVTVPTPDKNSVLSPNKNDYANLEIILLNLQKLRCNMYDDSIVPVALANKLVSLSNHPSQILLEKFTKTTMKL